jgi:hypothetical protein
MGEPGDVPGDIGGRLPVPIPRGRFWCLLYDDKGDQVVLSMPLVVSQYL